jgi:hypothetical protein
VGGDMFDKAKLAEIKAALEEWKLVTKKLLLEKENLLTSRNTNQEAIYST